MVFTLEQPMLPLILASSSPYRRQLLQKLQLPFECCNPDIDEAAKLDEHPLQLVTRLAISKARAISQSYPRHLIIASDQVAGLNGNILTKPGNFDTAIDQLRQCSGQQVIFYTGLALLNTSSGQLQDCVETYTVNFRHLSNDGIRRYLLAEQPYDCAGSFKMEGLGITLFESLHGNDPNSLIGLPLIKLVTMLNHEGITVP
ncbi:MAG: nucleoside triphosphate pyrophosphatase [Spongiibacteraceae bacterium]